MGIFLWEKECRSPIIVFVHASIEGYQQCTNYMHEIQVTIERLLLEGMSDSCNFYQFLHFF